MYDNDANAAVRRELAAPGVVGADDATMAKFLLFQDTKLKAVHALVTTAGTNAAAGFDILVGTDSVGAVTFGTNTAGSVLHSGVLDAPVPANGVVELKGKPDSATAVVSVVLEHQVDVDATRT